MTLSATTIFENGQKITSTEHLGPIDTLSQLAYDNPIQSVGLTFGLAFVLLLIIGLVSKDPYRMDGWHYFTPYVVAIVSIVPLFLLLHNGAELNQEQQDKRNQWTENQVMPYILRQPHVDIEISNMVESAGVYLIEYTDENNSLKTIKLNKDAVNKNAKNETRYLRFYQLSDNLGGGFVPWDYPLTAHIPE